MSIVDLQRSIAEAGRIRIGQQVSAGNGKTRPAKLDTFRLTSADKQRIEEAAELFGGTIAAWTAPAGPQWQVITKTAEIDVIVPPSAMAFSQHLELWSAGGCQRRCDGVTEVLSQQPCLCDPEQRECDFHTRLSVMIRDLPGLALWRLDTQGWYAARELAGAVEILTLAAGRGVMIPARLLLEQRSVKRPGKDGKPQTLRFAVPRLDLGITPGELLLSGSPAPGVPLAALTDGAPPERRLTPVPLIEGPRPTIADQSAPPPARPARRNAAPEIPASGRRRGVTEEALPTTRPGKVAGDEGYWRARAFAEGAERGIGGDQMRKLAAMQLDLPIEGFSMSALDEGEWEAVHRLVLGFPERSDASTEPVAGDALPFGDATAEPVLSPAVLDLAARIRAKAATGGVVGPATAPQLATLGQVLKPIGWTVTQAGLRALWPDVDVEHLTGAQADAVVVAADSDPDFVAHWRGLSAVEAVA